MADKAPKISAHAPAHKQALDKQSSFIHKKGEQAFFGPSQSHVSVAAPSFIQPKLQVSKPGDPFEQEAEHTAEKVMRMQEPSSVTASSPSVPPDESIQPSCIQCEEEEEQIQKQEEDEDVQAKMYVNNSGSLIQREEDDEVQSKVNDEEDVQRKEEEEEVQPFIYRKPTDTNDETEEEDVQPKLTYLAREKDRGPPVISPSFENNLHSNKGSGKAMDSNTQQFMESRFNANFSGVKVHTDAKAAEMSSGINAQAFTHGKDIYFNSGKYSPGTGAGKHLLAHELTHTIQQGAATSVQPFLSTKLKSQATPQRKTTSFIQRKTEPPGSADVRPELKRAVTYAKSQIGKVDAGKKNQDGTRAGWEHLKDYYQVAMGEDKVIPEGGVYTPGAISETDIKYKSTGPAQQPNQPISAGLKDRDKMPSWCGIFVFWSLNKGGVPMPKWTLGGSAVKLKAAYPPGYIPKPGDIAYFNTNSHYAIVEKTEPENPETKDRKNIKVLTVNGNTAGEDNLGGQIQVKGHPVSHWDGFFNPLYGILDKMPKDAAEFTDAEMNDILTKAGAALSSGSGAAVAPSQPAEIKPYTPAAAPVVTSDTSVAEVKTEDTPVGLIAEEQAQAPEAAIEEKPEEMPAPKSPEEDPAFQQVVKKAGQAKATQQVHGSPQEKANAAQLASEIPKDIDVASQAQFHQVGAMDVQEAQRFSKENFKQQLMERVKEALPKNDNETVEMYEDSSGTHKRMEKAKENAKGDVKVEKEKAGNAISQTAAAEPKTEGISGKVSVPMANEDAGKAPFIPKAETAAPKPKTDPEISMEKDAQELDNEMTKDNVSEAQLEKSNEPSFTGALENKKDAQQKARKAPQDYREQEQPQLAKAEDGAKQSVFGKVADMNNVRTELFGKVDTDKTATKDKDAAKRKEIADNLQRIYTSTKTKVEGILAALEKEVTDDFDAAANAANAEFERRVNERLKKFYGWTTADDTIKEWATGQLDPEINLIFTQERDLYITKIDASITIIAEKVETQLNAAMQGIADGKKEIDTYWNSLDPETKKIGEDAKTDILGKFDELEQSVQDKHEKLLNDLSEKYKKNVGELQEKFDKIKEENQGWLSGAINAIRAVIKTILDLKDMLFNTLARVAAVIGDIIDDPIGFLGNLVSAVQTGLNNFTTNIVLHLKKGLFEWLLGNMPPGIVFPEKWDLTGIFQFVMQILGITWTNIRMRAVKKLGEPVVSALEEVFEIFQIIRKEGLAGLWNYIKDKVGDLQVMVIDAIQNFLVEKIIKAGIMWVIGLLNPAGAFIKACQAIYKIVMFFIEKGKQILDFVNTVIDSIANIVSGNLGGAAKMIEDSLARLIPLAIGFLASLLGLDGVSEKVQKIITAIQAPINKAIDWILDKAIALAKKLGIDKLAKKVKGGVDKGKDWAKKKAEQGKTMAKDAAGRVLDWLGIRKPFKLENGEKHEIYFSNTKDENAPVTIASTDPNTLEAIIASRSWLTKPLAPPTIRVLKKEGGAIDKLRPDRTVTAGKKIQGHFTNIAGELSTVAGVPIPPTTATPNVTRGSGSAQMGEKLQVHPLSLNPGNLSGSDPTVHSDMEEELNRRYPKQFVRGHMLNNNLHGPGTERWNLVPISQKTNSDMKNGIERALKKYVISEGAVVSFSVNVVYKGKLDVNDKKNFPEKQIPDTLSFTLKQLEYKNNKWQPANPQPGWAAAESKTIEHDTRNIENFGGVGPLVINLNTSDERDLEQLPEIGPSKAAAIVNYRETTPLGKNRVRWFTSIDQLVNVPGIGQETINAIATAPNIKV